MLLFEFDVFCFFQNLREGLAIICGKFRTMLEDILKLFMYPVNKPLFM